MNLFAWYMRVRELLGDGVLPLDYREASSIWTERFDRGLTPRLAVIEHDNTDTATTAAGAPMTAAPLSDRCGAWRGSGAHNPANVGATPTPATSSRGDRRASVPGLDGAGPSNGDAHDERSKSVGHRP